MDSQLSIPQQDLYSLCEGFESRTEKSGTAVFDNAEKFFGLKVETSVAVSHTWKSGETIDEQASFGKLP